METMTKLAAQGGPAACDFAWPEWPLHDDAEETALLQVLRSGKWWYGERVRQFGDKDGYGGTSEGIFIATGKQAQITSPADGDVEFAGEFRSYGKLVIVNVGDGYHLLLAGLDTISVTPGQKVTAGEPVGSMGNQPARATLIGDRIDDLRPILYVEVRKGSDAINSSKWWQKTAAKAAGRRNNGGNEG